jgi:23S rRNA A2030 N6-methylase RlmJ
MSEQTTPPENTVLIRAGDQQKNKKPRVPLEELLDSLKSAQDDIGQICELTSEEETLVNEFFESFLRLMQSFTATIQVSTEALPDYLGDVARASMDPTGELMLMYPDGSMLLRNLLEEENRDLMTAVLEDVLPTLKQLFNTHRKKVEGRMKFLSSVTKEVQKMSRAVSKATT